MRRWRAVVPIVLAFVIAGAGSYFVHQWLKRQTKPEPVEQPEKAPESVPVIVAAVDIEWGAEISKRMIKQQAFPKSGLPEDYFRDSEALVGRVAQMPIKVNMPIMEALLAPDSVETGGIRAIIKKGRRAIAVSGNKVLGLSGFIGPGSRVDVLLTTTDPGTGDTITKTVLEDLLVLAAGTQMKNETTLLGEGKPSPVDVYTLEVTPEQAEKITLAASKGRLGFALRGVADTDIVLTRGQRLANLLGAYREEPAVIAALSPPTEERVELSGDAAEPEEAGETDEEEEAPVCEPCAEEWMPPEIVDETPAELFTGPEVQVEIINGTEREVQRFKL
jgi:pilus assembly protein CpaB